MNEHFKDIGSPKIQGYRVVSNNQSLNTGIFLILFVCVSFNLWAQVANPKRSILYTLGQNEEILYNEYFVMQDLDKNRFVCIVHDTLKNTNTFVFNGKRVISTNSWIDIKNINLNEENGYIFSYCKGENDCYVNNKGSEDGPFDDFSFWVPYEHQDNENHDYFYKLAGKWYGHKDRKNKLIQKKVKEVDPKISSDYENGKYYVKINGVRIPFQQGYDYVYYLQTTENGKYAFAFTKDNKVYVNINGTISSAYDAISHLTINNNGIYSYQYVIEGDGITYLNNNGIKSKAELLESVLQEKYELEIYSTNQENSFYSSYKYEYVVIDGRRLGKSPALGAWYDKDKNAFIWNSIEGRELVVYEYKF